MPTTAKIGGARWSWGPAVRRSGQRLQALNAEKVNRGREDKGAGPEGDRRQIMGDPQAPRHSIVETGHLQAVKERPETADRSNADEPDEQREPERKRVGKAGAVGRQVKNHSLWGGRSEPW